MLTILNKSYEVVGNLNSQGDLSRITTYFDDEYTQNLETGSETFQFSTLANTSQAQHLVVGNFVAFKEDNEYKLFNIIEIEEVHEDTFIKNVYCEMASVELINEIIRPMKIVNSNVKKFLNTILEQTEWELGKLDIGLTEVMDFEITDYTSVYNLIQEYVIGVYGAEISYRVEIKHGKIVGKYIDVYSQRGNDNGFRFAYGSNLTSVTKTVDMTELATCLIGVGNNGLTFKNIVADDKPLNQDFIENEKAYKQWNINGSHIVGVHNADTDSEYELLRLTRIALEERANPKLKYEMKVELLGEDVKIGDVVKVVDHEFNPPLYLSARVNTLIKSKTNPANNECILSNFKEINSNITNEMRQLATQLEGYVNSQFPISSDKIQDGAIGEQQISKTYATQLISEAVFASMIETKELVSQKAEISQLTSIIADIETLYSKKIEVTELNVIKGELQELISKKADIESLKTIVANIETLYSEKVNVTELNATKGELQELVSQKADIELINSTKAEISELISENITVLEGKINLLESNSINVSQLNAINGVINSLQSSKADITDLNATNATIGTLQTLVGEINTLVGGNLTMENIQSLVLSSDKVTIENAFIKDAMIESINAGKILAGSIDTGKVTISSNDGGIEIVGNTQKFKDKNGKVRIQIGRDINNEFTFTIFDETGKGILIDHTGVKEGALADNIIKENMISANAIGEKQIDYNSFASGFNKDTNINNLKASKIKLNNENQTLEVGFNQLKSQADDTKSKTETNTANLEIHQDKIKTLISDTIVEKNGENVKLKDAHSSLEQTVNGFSTKITEQSTKIKEIQDVANSVTGKLTEVESKQSSLTQDLNGFKTNVSNTYSTKTELNNFKETTNTQIGKISSIETNLNEITSKVSIVENTTNLLDNKVTSYETRLTNAEQKISDSSIINTVNSVVDNKIQGIKIGGENFVRNYNFNNLDYWISNDPSKAFIDLENNCAKLTTSNNEVYLSQSLNISNFKKDESFVLQYNLKLDNVQAGSGKLSTIIGVLVTAYDETGQYIGECIPFIRHSNERGTNDWQKIVTTAIVNENINNAKILKLRLYARNITGNISIKDIKLEKGNIPTDLSPSSLEFTEILGKTEQILNENIDKTIKNAKEDITDYIYQNYTDKSEFANISETLKSEIKQTNDNISMTFQNATTYTKEVEDKIEEYQKTVATHIRFDENGIELGKSSSPFTTVLDNTKLSFKQENEEVAYISNNKMHITQTEIKENLRLGKKENGYFIWQQNTNGNLSLKWSEN